MSNSSIILRLENKFNDLVEGKIDALKFGDYLISSANALEAVNSDIVQTARDFSSRLEMVYFVGEEVLEKIVADLQVWLQSIKLQIKLKPHSSL